MISKHTQGDTFTREIEISSLSVNTEGWICFITLKLDYEQTTPDAQAKALINAQDVMNGSVILTIPASEMKLELGKYYYDVQLSQPSQSGGESIITTVFPPREEWKDYRIEIIPELTVATE
jgi:hypothetical protein